MICSPRLHTVCILFIGLIVACHGQRYSKGTCAPLNSFTTATLTLASLVNTWREIARTPTLLRHDWRCTTYTFLEITANLKYSVSITGIRKLNSFARASGTVDVVNGNVAVTGAGTSLKFTVNYGGKEVVSDYYIVRTFNQNYLALYACQNFLFGKIDSAIILTLPAASEASITAALNSLSRYGIGRNDLEYSYTNECL